MKTSFGNFSLVNHDSLFKVLLKPDNGPRLQNTESVPSGSEVKSLLNSKSHSWYTHLIYWRKTLTFTSWTVHSLCALLRSHLLNVESVFIAPPPFFTWHCLDKECLDLVSSWKLKITLSWLTFLVMISLSQY